MLFFQLFITFFKIGLFGFGGGFAILSLIQNEVVTKHGWMTFSEFTDIVAVSQMTPGPIGINAATYVGYTAVVNAGYSAAWGTAGSLLATFSTLLPSFILMFVVSRFLMKYAAHPAVRAVFSVLRPVVIGLIASAALMLMNKENFGSPVDSTPQFILSVILCTASFLAINKWKVNPIFVILVSGAIGGIFYGFLPI
ncbi:MAG: chromate transporter [Bacteroidaceae bacterium]|nr:chromate transporter [Bacteroidaceae bacterium]